MDRRTEAIRLPPTLMRSVIKGKCTLIYSKILNDVKSVEVFEVEVSSFLWIPLLADM